MSGLLLGLITMLADAAPSEPLRTAAAHSEGRNGAYVVIAAAFAAAATALTVRARRKKGG
jgi:hypothetical protein